MLIIIWASCSSLELKFLKDSISHCQRPGKAIALCGIAAGEIGKGLTGKRLPCHTTGCFKFIGTKWSFNKILFPSKSAKDF